MRLLTINDLVSFYEQRGQNCVFDANYDEAIIVQVEGLISFDDNYDPTSGLLKTHLKSCHILDNRNSSFISEDSMTQAIPSFYNRPILGYIHQLDDGTWDFHGHDMEQDEDGNIVYKEIPVGVIPESCNAQLVFDKDMKKTYLEVDGYIYEEYSKAADILKERGGEAKVSVEIAVEQLSYDAKKKLLNIEKFHFNGVTILGKEKNGTVIQEGMLGSKINISDFSKQSNSLFNNSEQDKKLNELLEKFDKLITIFNQHSQVNNLKGGEQNLMNIEELLNKYNKTLEDVEFDYSNLSQEELEAKFAEVFGTEENSEDTNDQEEGSESDAGNENDEQEGTVLENAVMTRQYTISHEDIRYSLYNLLAPYEEADNEWYFITAVYDDHFAYESWNGGKIYGQKYTTENDNVLFDGERYTLHRELLTDAEFASLNEMRANYSLISEKLTTYENRELEQKKEAVFADVAYEQLKERTDFVELMEKAKDYSVEELREKADAILGRYTKEQAQFTFSRSRKPFVSLNGTASSDNGGTSFAEKLKSYSNITK